MARRKKALFLFCQLAISSEQLAIKEIPKILVVI